MLFYLYVITALFYMVIILCYVVITLFNYVLSLLDVISTFVWCDFAITWWSRNLVLQCHFSITWWCFNITWCGFVITWCGFVFMMRWNHVSWLDILWHSVICGSVKILMVKIRSNSSLLKRSKIVLVRPLYAIYSQKLEIKHMMVFVFSWDFCGGYPCNFCAIYIFFIVKWILSEVFGDTGAWGKECPFFLIFCEIFFKIFSFFIFI